MSVLRLRAAVAEQSVRESDQGNRKVLSRLQSLCKAEENGEINEKWRLKMAVQIDQEKCNGCGMCVDVCPLQSISLENDKAKVDKDTCTECEQCVDECPNKAISAP